MDRAYSLTVASYIAAMYFWAQAVSEPILQNEAAIAWNYYNDQRWLLTAD